MTMLTMLKRTTALAALVALPLAPAAVHAESAQATGTQPPAAGAEAQRDLVPSDKEIDSYKSKAETAAESTTVIKKESGEYVETDAAPEQAQQGQGDAMEQATDAAQQPGLENVEEQQLPGQAGDPGAGDPWVEKTGQTAGSDDQTAQQQDAGETAAEGQEGAQAGEAAGQTGAQTTGQQETGQQATGQQQTAGPADDVVVAKVGDREIHRSDVLSVIGMLPPQLQQQPPEMLIPIALDQLVMRELILQEAREAGLADDPAVTSLAEGATERAKEDAMVQVWLEKELGKAVTEEKVKETYETVKQQMGDQAPDVEVLRPQIEQELRQQAFLDLSRDLQEDAEITLYGPDGQPVTQ